MSLPLEVYGRFFVGQVLASARRSKDSYCVGCPPWWACCAPLACPCCSCAVGLWWKQRSPLVSPGGAARPPAAVSEAGLRSYYAARGFCYEDWWSGTLLVEVLPLQRVAAALGRVYVGTCRGVRGAACAESYRVRHAGFVPRRGAARVRSGRVVSRVWDCLYTLLRVLVSGRRVRFRGGVVRRAAGGARCFATGVSAAGGALVWQYECVCEYGGATLWGSASLGDESARGRWRDAGGGVGRCVFSLESRLCLLLSSVVDLAFHASRLSHSAAFSSALCNRYVACRGVISGGRGFSEGQSFVAASRDAVLGLHAAAAAGCVALAALGEGGPSRPS
jgi:hypothetical protein